MIFKNYMLSFQGKGKKKRKEKKNSKGREGGLGWLSVDDLQSRSSPSLTVIPILDGPTRTLIFARRKKTFLFNENKRNDSCCPFPLK